MKYTKGKGSFEGKTHAKSVLRWALILCYTLIITDLIVRFFVPRHPEFINSYDEYASNNRGYFRDSKVGENNKKIFFIDRTKEVGRTFSAESLPDDAFKVLSVGDSFVYGQGVYLEDTFPKKLEEYISAPKVFGINGGESGADIEVVYDVFLRLFNQHDPNLSIYGYVLNDILVRGNISSRFDESLAPPKNEPGYLWDFMNFRSSNFYSSRSQLLKSASKYSAIVDRLVSLFEVRKVRQNTIRFYQETHNLEKNKAGIQKTFEYVEKMAELAKRHNKHFLVVIFPLLVDLNEKSYPFLKAHSMLKDQLGSRGISYLDLFTEYKKHKAEELWVHPVDQHPNDLAHKIAAKEIANWWNITNE